MKRYFSCYIIRLPFMYYFNLIILIINSSYNWLLITNLNTLVVDIVESPLLN